MKFRIPAAFPLLLIPLWLGPAAPVSSQPDSGRGEPDKPGAPGSKERAEKGDPLRNLSPEERERFREVMRRALGDPAVLQARDEVKKATVAYQKALIEVIKRNDPKVLALMEKVRASPDSPIKSFFSGGGPGGRGRPGGGFRDMEAFLTGESPGFLKSLSEEQREIYRKAREQALQSGEFQEILGKFRALRKTDEAMRNQRIEVFGRVRQTLHAEMIKADKRVEEFLPREEFRPKGPSPAGRRGPDPGEGPNRKRFEPGEGNLPKPPGKPE